MKRLSTAQAARMTCLNHELWKHGLRCLEIDLSERTIEVDEEAGISLLSKAAGEYVIGGRTNLQRTLNNILSQWASEFEQIVGSLRVIEALHEAPDSAQWAYIKFISNDGSLHSAVFVPFFGSSPRNGLHTAWRLGINPGSQAQIARARQLLPEPQYRCRSLSSEELEELWRRGQSDVC